MQIKFLILFTLIYLGAEAASNQSIGEFDGTQVTESTTQKLWRLLKNTKQNPDDVEKDLLTKNRVFLVLLEDDKSGQLMNIPFELELLAESFKKVNSSLTITYISPEHLKTILSQKDNENRMRHTFTKNQERSLSLLFAPAETQLRLYDERSAIRSIFPNLTTIWLPGKAAPDQEGTAIRTFSEHDVPTKGPVTDNPKVGSKPINWTPTKTLSQLIDLSATAIH